MHGRDCCEPLETTDQEGGDTQGIGRDKKEANITNSMNKRHQQKRRVRETTTGGRHCKILFMYMVKLYKEQKGENNKIYKIHVNIEPVSTRESIRQQQENNMVTMPNK